MIKAKARDTKGIPREVTKGGGKGYNKGGKSFGKGGKSFGKGAKGKGKGPFNGNCHNCGEYGHRAVDCPKPRQSKGVGMVAEQQQQQQPFSPYSQQQNQHYQPWSNQWCAFMVTTAQDTHVDYRGD